MSGTAGRFAEALHHLEETGDPGRLVELFSDDAEVGNSTTATTHRGRDGAEGFWKGYRESFDTIRSDFRVVVEGPAGAALEWHATGELAGGSPIEYGGVTVLEFDGDAVSRCTAYFDPSAITRT